MSTIRLAKFLPVSEANGPGRRSVFWTQGCSLGCAGCINRSWSWPKESHTAQDLTPTELAAMVAPTVEGISLTGGEPFEQDAGALAKFLDLVSWRGRDDKPVLIFSGYTLPELGMMADDNHNVRLILRLVDVLVVGRYQKELRTQDQPLIGSSNQHVFFMTDRYNKRSLEQVLPTEIHIDMDTGTSISTGVTQG
mgnify:CR=1 FL=1